MLRILFLLVCLSPVFLRAQPRSQLLLTEAYRLAKANYPLLKNKALLPQISELKLQNLEKSKHPKITWKTEASLQSETIEFPSDTPVPVSIDIPFYSARTYAEARYLIYDGGVNDARQQIESMQLETELQSIEVELNHLKERVNQYFMGALLLRQQIELMKVTLSDLAIRKRSVEAGVRHGVLLESEVDRIRVRELELTAEIEQRSDEIRALMAILSALTGVEISENADLSLPEMNTFVATVPVDRPEQRLFQLEKQGLMAKESLITASRKPRVSAFARAGMGYPDPLNFFDIELSPYALGGISFSWNLFDWGKGERDRQLLSLQSRIIDHRQEAFEFNIDLGDGKYREDLAKIERLIENDKAIATLQNKILKQLAVQLENGVITSSDYLTQANAELKARQQLQLHELQLTQIKIDYLTKKGKL